MRVSLLLALALAAAPALATAQEEGDEQERDWDEPGRERLLLTAWGGQAFDTSRVRGDDRSGALFGGELAWAFPSVDVGVAGYGYRGLAGGGSRDTAPVLLLRLTERFETRRGLEASFGFGVGAARPRGWVAWFQVALGVRLDLGPRVPRRRARVRAVRDVAPRGRPWREVLARSQPGPPEPDRPERGGGCPPAFRGPPGPRALG